MKKTLFAIFALCTMTAAIAAQYTFPGWNTIDKAKLEAGLKTCHPSNVSAVKVLIALADTPAANFDQLCAVIDKVAAQEKYTAETVISLKKQLPYCQHRFISDAWKFCQTTPTSYDYHYVRSYAKELNLSAEQQYEHMFGTALNNSNATIVSRATTALLELADSMPADKVKADLQRLNRRLSKNLLKDKKAWEPIIAMIRTTLETY